MTDNSRRRRVVWGLTAVGAAAATVVGLQTASLGGNGLGNSGKGLGNTTGPLGQALVASVQATTPLAPGRSATITVRVQNPNNQPVVLTGLSGKVTGVSSQGVPSIPQCDPAWFQLGSWQGSQPIAAKSTGTATMLVTFDNRPTTNQDNCKGVRYTYAFTATGRQS